MRKLIPIILALIGLAAGGGAGYFLRPPPEETSHDEAAACPDVQHAAETADDVVEGEPTSEFVKLNNQFVVPVVREGRVSALVIMSLSLEVKVGMTEKVYSSEPKIRDALLQVLFDHANSGGFDGNFTGSTNMEHLRTALLEVSQKILGDSILSILVSDIVRQDS